MSSMEIEYTGPVYGDLPGIKPTPWFTMLCARLFGERLWSFDSGIGVECARWRGVVYVLDVWQAERPGPTGACTGETYQERFDRETRKSSSKSAPRTPSKRSLTPDE